MPSLRCKGFSKEEEKAIIRNRISRCHILCNVKTFPSAKALLLESYAHKLNNVSTYRCVCNPSSLTYKRAYSNMAKVCTVYHYVNLYVSPKWIIIYHHHQTES
jgi:hypothetical protein